MSIDIFKETNRTTVVFPETDTSKQAAIERILREVYNSTEVVQEVEVKGLIPQEYPKDTNVRVISKSATRTYKRLNNIKTDKRNPFPAKTVYEALTENGITAFGKFAGKFNGKTEYDVQIAREMYNDLKRFVTDHYTEKFLMESDLSIIKDYISTLSKYIVPASIEKILQTVAIPSVDAFFKDGTEEQLRSAAHKIMSDTIKRLTK